jgi:hypothetical protein
MNVVLFYNNSQFYFCVFSKCVILIISSIVAYFLYKLLNFVRFIEIKKSIIQELIFLLNKKKILLIIMRLSI